MAKQKIEAVEDILSPAFNALAISPEDAMSVGRFEGDLVITFKKCVIGFGRGGFFIDVSPGEGDNGKKEAIENIEILFDLFVSAFGEPQLLAEGEIPVWPIGEVDISYLETSLALMGYDESSEITVGPRIVH